MTTNLGWQVLLSFKYVSTTLLYIHADDQIVYSLVPLASCKCYKTGDMHAALLMENYTFLQLESTNDLLGQMDEVIQAFQIAARRRVLYDVCFY